MVHNLVGNAPSPSNQSNGYYGWLEQVAYSEFNLRFFGLSTDHYVAEVQYSYNTYFDLNNDTSGSNYFTAVLPKVDFTFMYGSDAAWNRITLLNEYHDGNPITPNFTDTAKDTTTFNLEFD